MIALTSVKIWHDEDDYTEYRIKVAYDLVNKTIEVIEYPEGSTPLLQFMIDDKLDELLNTLAEEDDEDYDQWEDNFGDK
jgi:hypothetical protein